MDISKITAIKLQNFPNSSKTDKPQEETEKKADLSKLPDGVSKFNIDGNEIVIWKKGDDIQSQVVSDNEVDMDEIYKKIEEELNK